MVSRFFKRTKEKIKNMATLRKTKKKQVKSVMPPKKKNGRPPIWTEHTAEDLIEKLLKWAEKKDSYTIVQFCKENKLAPQRYYELIKKSERFSDASTYARLCIGSRIVENINSKHGTCHPAFFNKFIRINNTFLDNHLKEQEKVEINEISSQAVRIIDFAKYKKEMNSGNNKD